MTHEASGPSAESLRGDLARGLVAAIPAGLAMERTLAALYNLEGSAVRRHERTARRGQPAMRRAAVAIARLAGLRLSPSQSRIAGRIVQVVVGLIPGVFYAPVRRRMPAIRKGHGLLYGAAVSLLLDEAMNPVLGFTPGPRAFPWQTHARGVIGHLVYGAVLETVLAHLAATRAADHSA